MKRLVKDTIQAFITAVMTAAIPVVVALFLSVGLFVGSFIVPVHQPAWAALDSVKAEIADFLPTLPADYWVIKDVNQLKALMQDPQNPAQLIDVREPSEYAAGYIEGAINIPLRLLAVHQNLLPSDRPLVLYCSSGYRTAMGVLTLHLLGFSAVYGYQPSIEGWKAAGEPIVVSQSALK